MLPVQRISPKQSYQQSLTSTNNPFKVFVDGSRKQRAANGIVLTVAANGDKVQENPDGSVITT
jgi:hypothetical protein